MQNNQATDTAIQYRKNFDKRLHLKWDCFHCSALLLCSVISVRLVTIFLNSSNEFSVSFGEVIKFSGLFFIYAFCAFLLVGLIFNLRCIIAYRKLLTAIVVGVAVLLWLQGNFFLWDYGKLDGRPLSFSAYTVHGFIEALIWVAVLAFAMIKHKLVATLANKICIIVVASLMANLISGYINQPKAFWHKDYHVTFDNYLTFSDTQNVIIIVIDAARGDIFEEILSELSHDEKKIFEGFTFFRNTSGTFNATYQAVVGYLTGQMYDYKTPRASAFPELFTSSTSIPFQLKRNGFFSEVYPYANSSVYLSPKIVDNLRKRREVDVIRYAALRDHDFKKIGLVARFNFLPHFIKKRFFDASDMYVTTTAPTIPSPKTADNAEVRTKETELPANIIEHLNFNRSIIDKLGSSLTYRSDPVFKYLHYHGAHPPFIHDETFTPKRLPFNLESYKKQYKGSLLLTLKVLTSSLKRQNVFDRTMLIVIGDHGLHIAADGLNSDKKSEFRPLVNTLSPLMLIKPFGDASNDLKISSAPVSLFDIPATIFSALGISTRDNGRSVFSIHENEARIRYAYSHVPARSGDTHDGAFKYEILGDVRDLSSWKFTYQYYKAYSGSMQINQEEYESRLEQLNSFLFDTAGFILRD
jgi:hypothetical protein